MRRFVAILLFLGLTGEVAGQIYDGGKWSTPMEYVGTLLFALPVKSLPAIDVIMLAFVFMGMRSPSAKLRAPPMVRFLKVALIALGGAWVWGIVRGGNAYQTIWQVHQIAMMFVYGLGFMAVLKTPRDFRAVGIAIVCAGIFRAFMAFTFKFVILKTLHLTDEQMGSGSGFVVTTHDDTALFVTGIVIVVAYAVEARTRKAILTAALAFGILAFAIQVNNRRLAWLSLGGSLAILYALMPKNAVKRKLNRAGLLMVPVLAAYIAIGWGRTEGIFKPVGSISTMFGKKEDTSSETRNIENYNLVVTMRNNPLLGVGWGHEYDEVSVAYSIKEIFPQYRFIPHNSVLGLLAFTGLLGFGGVWMAFAVCVFLGARTYRAAPTPLERAAAITAVAEVAIFTNQSYGDMGLQSMTATLLMGCAFAVAGRLSVSGGGWVLAKPKPKAEEPSELPALPAPSGEQAAVEVREGEDPRG